MLLIDVGDVVDVDVIDVASICVAKYAVFVWCCWHC